MVNIAEVISNGIAFDPKNWRKERMDSLSNIPAAVERLFNALDDQRVAYTLVGGLAILNYLDARNTIDVDLILSLNDAMHISGLHVLESDDWFAFAKFEDLRVDLLLPTCPVFRLVRDEYSKPIRYGRRTISTATIEGIAIMKLFALPSRYRQFDFGKAAVYETDLFRLMQERNADLDKLLIALKPHISENDQWALEQLVSELKTRAARMKNTP